MVQPIEDPNESTVNKCSSSVAKSELTNSVKRKFHDEDFLPLSTESNKKQVKLEAAELPSSSAYASFSKLDGRLHGENIRPFHAKSFEKQEKFGGDKLSACPTYPAHSIQAGQLTNFQNASELSVQNNLLSSSFHSSTYEKIAKPSAETCNETLTSSCRNSLVQVASTVCQTAHIKNESESPDSCTLSDIQLVQAFSDEIKNKLNTLKMKTHAIGLATAAAKSLGVKLVYDMKIQYAFPRARSFVCDFYLKDILMSTAEGRSKQKSKHNSVRIAIEQLHKMPAFVIKTIDGKKYLKPSKTEDKSHFLKPFTLNHDMFQNSLKLNFVIFDNNENKQDNKKTASSLLADSERFSNNHLETEFEKTPEGLVCATIKLHGEPIGFGVGHKVDAHKIASYIALQKFRKEVYTIKVKKHEDCGISIELPIILNNNVDDILESNTREDTGSSTGYVEHYKSLSDPAGNLFDVIRKIDELLCKYKDSNIYEDLVFSPLFPKKARELITEIATTYKLHCTHRPADDKKSLRIERSFTVKEILNHLVEAGGSSKKYTLVDAANDPAFVESCRLMHI